MTKGWVPAWAEEEKEWTPAWANEPEPEIAANPVRDALLAEKKKRGLDTLGGLDPDEIGKMAPETRLASGIKDIPYYRAEGVDEKSIPDSILAAAGPWTETALNAAQAVNIPAKTLEGGKRILSPFRMASAPTEQDVPTAKDFLGPLGAIPGVDYLAEHVAGPVVNPVAKAAHGFLNKYGPASIVRRELAPKENESTLESAALLPARGLAQGWDAMATDPTNLVLMGASGGGAGVTKAAQLAAEATFLHGMAKEIGPSAAGVGTAYGEGGLGAALQKAPEALVPAAFAAMMGSKMVGEGISGGQKSVDHLKNVGDYKDAVRQDTINKTYEAKRQELAELDTALKDAVNKAGAEGATTPEASPTAQEAAALKARRDALQAELEGDGTVPLPKSLGGTEVPLQPRKLTGAEERHIARGRPKFGEARGGGQREGLATPDTTEVIEGEDGKPIRVAKRLRQSADEVRRTLNRWSETDPELPVDKIVVHDSVMEPEFYDNLDPQVQKWVQEQRAAGKTDADISGKVSVPGLTSPDGMVHILAPRLISLDHLYELGMHEGTHVVAPEVLGTEGAQTPEQARLQGALAARAGGKDALGQEVGLNYPGASPRVLAEEVLAHGQEHAATRQAPGRIDKAVASVRSRLRGNKVLGRFVQDASDAEIRVLLNRAKGILSERPTGKAKTGSSAATVSEIDLVVEAAQRNADAIRKAADTGDTSLIDAVLRNEERRTREQQEAAKGVDEYQAERAAEAQKKAHAAAVIGVPEHQVLDAVIEQTPLPDLIRRYARHPEQPPAAEPPISEAGEAKVRQVEQEAETKAQEAARKAQEAEATRKARAEQEAARRARAASPEGRTEARMAEAAERNRAAEAAALAAEAERDRNREALDAAVGGYREATPEEKAHQAELDRRAAVARAEHEESLGAVAPDAVVLGKAAERPLGSPEPRLKSEKQLATEAAEAAKAAAKTEKKAPGKASPPSKKAVPAAAEPVAPPGPPVSTPTLDRILEPPRGGAPGTRYSRRRPGEYEFTPARVSNKIDDTRVATWAKGDLVRLKVPLRRQSAAHDVDANGVGVFRPKGTSIRIITVYGKDGMLEAAAQLNNRGHIVWTHAEPGKWSPRKSPFWSDTDKLGQALALRDPASPFMRMQKKLAEEGATRRPDDLYSVSGARSVNSRLIPHETAVDVIEGFRGGSTDLIADELGVPKSVVDNGIDDLVAGRYYTAAAHGVIDWTYDALREAYADEHGIDWTHPRAETRDRIVQERRRAKAAGGLQGEPAEGRGSGTPAVGEGRPGEPGKVRFSRRQEETPEFRDWFGESKVVDEKGKPLRVYHGTYADSNFAEFRPLSHFGSPEAANKRLENEGRYKHAMRGPAGLQGGRVVPAYLSIKNPLRTEDIGGSGDASDWRLALGFSKALSGPELDRVFGRRFGDEPGAWRGRMVEALKDKGYDGIVYHNAIEGGGDSYVAFDPAQVKSATGNTGAFDPTNPDIRYSMRGASAQDADRRKLKDAQKMIRGGYDKEVVRKETGWHQGTDNRWRWEGDDSQARLNMEGYRKIPYIDNPRRGDGARLGDVLDHEDLYRSYPELANVRVVNAPRPEGTTMASFNEKTNTITLYPAIDSFEGGPLSALLHEVQHWVQTKEAFARGGNSGTVVNLIPPEDARRIAQDAAISIAKHADYNRKNAEAIEEVLKGYEYWADQGFHFDPSRVPEAIDMSPAAKRRFLSAVEWRKTEADIRRELADEKRAIATTEKRAEDARTATGKDLENILSQYADTDAYYRRLAGEEEARQTQKRAGLNPNQRRERDPELDFDSPREKQIVDMGRGEARYSRRDPGESQISWEALPGKATGWLRGIHAAPYEIRAAFTTDMDAKVLRDSMGRDRIARLFGVDETDQLVAPGYWKGERNPSRQLFIKVPDGPDGIERVKAYAAARGYVLRQEAVGFHLARNPVEGEVPNGYHADIGRMPTKSEYADFVSGINKIATPKEAEGGVFVPVPTHAGINMWTWSSDVTPERLREVYDAAVANIKSDASATSHPLVVDSELIENDWRKKGPNGEEYTQRYSATEGSPGVQGSLDQLRAAADKVGRQWAQKHGWGTRLGSPDPAVPGDLESLVGRDVNPNLKGQRRQKLFQDIAKMIDGRALADMKFAAESGRAMKGWYRESWQSIERLFGEDAERFTGLLAALSPQQGVRENLKMAVDAWQTWVDAGRPTDAAAVKELFPVVSRKWDPVKKRWNNQYATLDLEARFNNAVTALTDPGAELSGDKVESFRRNLRGDFDAVTNDTWMAYFSDWQQKVFGTQTGYLAGSYLVRRAAKKLGWTPAEVQETVWTFFRELATRADEKGVSAADVMKTMTQGDVISGSDSFAHLVRDPDVQKRLSTLGLDVTKLPDLPRLSAEEAAAPAVGPERGASGVSRRVAGRAQRQNDASWARSAIKDAGIEGLNDADPAALRKIADALGIPTAGRTRNETVAALRAYAEPTRFSRRAQEPWDIPLTPPQVEARVKLVQREEADLVSASHDYEAKKLDREIPQTWEGEVTPAARKIDLATSDDQWAAMVRRKGRNLDAAHAQALAMRVERRKAESKEAFEKLQEARDLGLAERESRGIDLQALIQDDFAKRLSLVAMSRAHINDGTGTARALAARAKIMDAGTEASPDLLVRKLLKELPDVSDENVADLHRLYYESPNEFTNALRTAMKPGWVRKFMEGYKASLLSSIGTHVANFSGNLIEPAARAAESLAAAGIDAVWSKATGKPRERFVGEAAYELRGQLKAIPDAFRKFVDEFSAQIIHQIEPSVNLGAKLEYQTGAIGPGPDFIPFDVGTAVRTPFRALTIADSFFKALGSEAELYKLAYRQARMDGFRGEAADARATHIIENARLGQDARWHEMMEQVHKGMMGRVFQGEPVKLVRTVMEMTHKHPLFGLVVPFTRTPAEITRLAWQRSPMGLLGGRSVDTTRQFLRESSGDVLARDAKGVTSGDVSDAWARPMVGTALAAAFGGLAAAGFLTGSGPVDPQEKKTLQATGWQPYSLRIPTGDGKFLYLPFSRFEPISSLMGIVADGFETKDERKIGEKIMGSVAQNYTNKTFWKGLNDVATAIASPDRSAKNIISSTVASAVVPAMLAKTAEAIDPTFREKRSGAGLEGTAEATKRSILRRVPGVSTGEEPIYDPMGEEAERPGTGLTRFALPVQPQVSRAGKELEAYLVQIHEAPSPIPREATIPKPLLPRGGDVDLTGKRIELTDQERAFLAQARRETASALRKQLDDIKRLPVDVQRQRIKRAFTQGDHLAMQRLWARSKELRERARAEAQR